MKTKIMVIFFLVIFYVFRNHINFLKFFIKEIWFPLTKTERRKLLLESVKYTPFYTFRNNSEPVTKSELMANLTKTVRQSPSEEEIYSFLQSPYQLWLNDYIIGTTSGTSGQMGIFINDRETWCETQAILFKTIFYPHLAKLLPFLLTGIRVVFIIPSEGHFVSRKLPVPLVNMPNIEIRFLSLFNEKLLETLNQICPHILYIFPSVLEKYYEKISFNPILIITGSEKLTFRKSLSRKFPKTKIIETYGAGECVFLGLSCKYGTIHLCDEYCDIEIIDKNGDLITEKYISGESIYVTNLINRCQPLIRYEIDDSLEYIDCFCGNTNPAVEIHGRKSEKIVFTDRFGEEHVSSSLMLKSVFISIPYPFSYQIVYYKSVSNHLDIIIETLHSIVYEIIQKNLLNYCNINNLDISYNFYKGPFIRDKSGKKRQINIYE